MTNIDWESELAELLQRLTITQQELLSLLASKRELLLASDHQGLAELVPQEELLSIELKACFDRRKTLLQKAAEEGLPSDSIQSLAQAMPQQQADLLQQPLRQVSQHSRLLRHQSLSQWVVVQRTLLHLSQMLEIIATGGQSQPTYDKGQPRANSGSLIDQAV